MAIHMIRIFSHWPDGYTVDEIDQEVQNWVDSHTEWLDDPVTHEISARNTDIGGSGTDYLAGDFRFEWGDDKQTLLDNCEATLQDYVDWYRFGYHECTHDGDGGACGWDDKVEWTKNGSTTIPSGVPDFQVQ